MNEMNNPTTARVPTVYFIDDSATMREVIKIAFRKENIQVITCADAASAIEQFNKVSPDAVITDVIMPDKDGYEVCDYIKQHYRFAKTPVILMSGVVNQSVAERATAVKADELIRKPFQPQDLVVRVKSLLYPGATGATRSAVGEEEDGTTTRPAFTLNGLFNPDATRTGTTNRPQVPGAAAQPRATQTLVAAPATPSFAPPTPPFTSLGRTPTSAETAAARPSAQSSWEVQKLRNEIRRLELFVKKLQAELEAEHQYCAALEAHFKTLQEGEESR
ncbi:MAG: response regulator [Candidatus Acidiferrales bacterium]